MHYFYFHIILKNSSQKESIPLANYIDTFQMLMPVPMPPSNPPPPPPVVLECKICGDIAGCGLNFGCFSCESCKAFFRRCCTKVLSQSCPFVGQCQITKASRRACPACRWQKCIQMGMRETMVDAWKKQWNERKEQQKGEKQKLDMKGGEEQKDIAQARRKRKHSPMGIGGPGCICKCKCQAKELAKGHVKMQVDEGTQTDGNDAPRAIALLAPSSGLLQIVEMLPGEKAKLDELVRANAILDSPLPVPQLLPFNLTLVDALRMSELAMRRMVGMCKQLAPFRQLDTPDQVALLRGSLLELLILRGAMAFDQGNEAWKHQIIMCGRAEEQQPQPLPFCLNLNVLPAKEKHSEDHKRFLLTFGEKWRTNRNVMLILHTIVLFTPRQNYPLASKDAVEKLHAEYCSLLKRYLTIECGTNMEAAFGHLMSKLGELHQLNASFQWLFTSRVNPAHLLLEEEPLLNELLRQPNNEGK